MKIENLVWIISLICLTTSLSSGQVISSDGELLLWSNAHYNNSTQFAYWSNMILGEGDKTLSEDRWWPGEWNKTIILVPEGDPETLFAIGYLDYQNLSLVTQAFRPVKKGPFGMRMGPKNCRFFIASNNGSVRLQTIPKPKYIAYSEARKRGITVY